jgi:hypothetical protein
MKSDDSLFSLIQALTQHEKRYFGLHAARHTKDRVSHLQRLFHLLEGQSSYDEEALKESLKDDPLCRQFAVYKNLLHHAILRALQSYRYENSPGMKVRSGMDKVEILVEKGKHAAALKMLHRTRILAEEYAQTGYLLEILAWERRLLRYLHPLTHGESLPRLEEYERRWITVLQEEMESMGIYDQLFAWVQVERRMEKKTLADQLEQMGNRLAALEVRALPAFNTTATLHLARALLRQMQGDYGGMLEAYSQLTAHWDSHPKMKMADPERYARVQVAWLNSALAAGKIGQHLPQIRALRKIPIQGMAERARTTFQSYNLELLWLLDQRDVEAALGFLPAFSQKLPEMLPYLDALRLNSFYLNAAILYFRAGEYHPALVWANRIQALDSSTRDSTLYRNAFLLSLICNCEIGNFQVAESQLGSIHRRLKGQDADWEFGSLVTGWIKRLLPQWGLPEGVIMRRAFHAALVEWEGRAQPVPLILDLIRDWARN